MDKITAFFRIFDIAFFAPGAVFFSVLQQLGLLDGLALNADLTKPAGILALVIGVTLIYLLGLVCHGIQRLIVKPFLRNSDRCDDGSRVRRSSYEHLDPSVRSDLVTYFWYMRATSWNLSVALTLGGLVCFAKWLGTPSHWLIAALALMSTLILIIVGIDFQRTVRSHMKGLV